MNDKTRTIPKPLYEALTDANAPPMAVDEARNLIDNELSTWMKSRAQDR